MTKLWIVIDHPNQVINAIGLAIRYRQDYSVGLLLSQHHYWKGIALGFLNDYFDSIHTFLKIEISKIIPRELLKLWQTYRKVSQLPIDTSDTFLVLSDNIILESLLFKRFPEVDRIKLLHRHIYFKYKAVTGDPGYYETWLSKLWRLLIFNSLQLDPILYLKHRNDPRILVMFFQQPLDELFVHVFYFTDTEAKTDEDNAHVLPDLSGYVGEKVISDRNVSKQYRVLFFGGSLHSEDEYQIAFTNRCLRYLERFYPEAELFYKPHPHDIIEQQKIALGAFRLCCEHDTTETLLLKKHGYFSHYFSVSSVSIVNCILFGLNNAYLFFKLYENYSASFEEMLQRQYHPVKQTPEMFIENFDIPPVGYAPLLLDVDVRSATEKITALL